MTIKTILTIKKITQRVQTFDDYLRIRQFNSCAAVKKIRKLLFEVEQLKNQKIIDDEKIQHYLKTITELEDRVDEKNALKKIFKPKTFIVKKNGQWHGPFKNFEIVTKIINNTRTATRRLDQPTVDQIYHFHK